MNTIEKTVDQCKIDLVPEEFDNYQIGVDTDVTFCLKELRVLTKVIRIF